MRVILLSVAAGILLTGTAIGGDCCEKGCGSCCSTTCKIVCEMKKVEKTVWAVECEQICVTEPNCCKSCCGCKSCGVNGCCAEGCREDGCCMDGCRNGKCCCDPCAALRNRPLVKPTCGKVHCRKKLIKKTVTCEVPTYKCIIVPCGSGCGECCDDHECEAPKQEKSAIKAAPLPPALRSRA
ncbi:MAG: hypothetical protein JXM70_05125 [Pirellulales bacterium]|nr:hypothetical protein [Pirellulales bacterium]